jgi:simple sugar transport system permease protein
MTPKTEVQEKASLLVRLKINILARYALIILAAFFAFGLILGLSGINPLKAYADIFAYTFGSWFGFSEVIVKMIPLLFTATAVALPSRVGLINVGAEGQLYMGAWLATWAALTFTQLPASILIPLMLLLGMVGGGLWALIPAVLRANGIVNETITSLILNYVAPTVVAFFIYGPWRSPLNAMYPQTVDFVAAARLPNFFGTRVHLGLVFGLIVLVLYWFLMNKTRWGLEMRSIGGNPQAARRNGLPITLYLVLIMCLGGGLAGMAGMVEIAGIHGRLRPGFSPGFGFMGFLISWLSGGNPLGILIMSFVFGVISSGGDILQITQGLPFAVVNILLAVTLFIVLARPVLFKGKKA